MKTLSSMYARPMWEDGADNHVPKRSHTLSFHSKTLQNSDKFRINSNKLGQIRIKLEQAVSKAS